jgi:thiamine pyrophosphokinase
MQHYAILLGGDLTPTPRLRQRIEGARVIAADSGMRHAEALQVMPELWVGDFDSAPKTMQQKYRDVPRMSYPRAKDKTDGALSISEALARGATCITLVAGFGGGFDHALSHGLQLLELAAQGVDCMMTSGGEEAYPLLTHLELKDVADGTRLSILGLTELRGLSIYGVRWPLDKAMLPLGSTWTLSNETKGSVAVKIGSGKALVLLYPGALQT